MDPRLGRKIFSGDLLTLPISKRTKVDIYSLKARFVVLLVGFTVAKFLFPIKEWGKKVKLGQF